MVIHHVLRGNGPDQLDQLIMATLIAFMTIFVVSTALNYLVL